LITSIHHINFLVHDLEAAVERYRATLGLAEFKIDTLNQRGVRTARVKLGDTWLILVQPLDPDSVPGKHLSEFGEGFFLLSLATDNLADSLETIEKSGAKTTGASRQGLDGWQVQDLDKEQFFGAQIQLTEEP